MKEKQISKNVTVSIPETREEHLSGTFAHLMNKNVGLGYYVPAKGYYKLVEVMDEPIHTDRKIERPVLANFNSESPNYFSDDTVMIEAKFLYNKMSIGNKDIVLKKNMIIQIKETSLVEASYKGKPYKTYKIMWNIVNE